MMGSAENGTRLGESRLARATRYTVEATAFVAALAVVYALWR
ncbi:hypothetical protein [Planomonospora venezuelensis]|uniref:Uncharacterized protein n=1 Tax=Planomonospora venezuelensis TaxID=1999 RepID=A0A841D571_PLAVE|nr:hypothetical protein [Planomonospora venezuelensis]MBB5965010.1 hypothetical protein [Planomonospora venezuelensis]GIN05433.1 hypothetical protein Pve01_70910 [Planomonospora venezuelensis]